MGYSRRISNYPEIITLLDVTHMMNNDDLMAIDVRDTNYIYRGCSLEKEFIELTHVNP